MADDRHSIKRSGVISLAVALVLSALGTPILKTLVVQGGHLGIVAQNAVSYCNILFVGNLCAAGVVFLFFWPSRLFDTFALISKKRWKALFANTIYANVISPILIVTALEDGGDVTNVIILLQTNAAFYAFFAWILTGETITKRCFAGLLIISLGVIATMFLPGATPIDYQHWCVIGAAACNSLGSCLAKQVLDDINVMPAFLILRNLVGAIVFFCLAVNMFGVEHFADAFTPGLWELMLVYAGIVVILAQLTWFKAVSSLPSETISSWSPIVPALAVFFAWLLLGEIPTISQWIGILIVIAGLGMTKVSIRRTNSTNPKSTDLSTVTSHVIVAEKPLTGA